MTATGPVELTPSPLTPSPLSPAQALTPAQALAALPAQRCDDDNGPRLVPATFRDGEMRQRRLTRLLVESQAADTGFARLTHLAGLVFGGAVASVILLDTVDDPVSSTGAAMMRDEATARLVRSTLDSSEAVLVEDLRADAGVDVAEYGGDPAVPAVRFFAGIPLADEEGVVLGAFCLCDTAPRRLDAAQRATLTELARWARRDLVDSEEMARARRAQESLLPTAPPQVPGYELAAVCVPTKSVGGDFYDFGTAPERLNVSLVDVMGKGTAAALVAATVRALLRASMGEVALGLGGRSPQALTRPIRGGVAGVVADIDRLVSADLARTATLVTGFFCDLVPQTGIVRYVDAGHGLAVLLRRDGGATWLRSADLPIGVELRGQWSDQEDVLHPGDTLLCVSDGLLDLIGGTEQALGSLAAMARSHSTAADLIGAIRRLTEVGVAVDDVTAVAVRREETP